MTLRAGYEPLLEAIRDADIPSLERLLSTNQYSVNTEIGYQSEDGKPYIITPLYWAVKVDQPSVCRFLLHKKADPYRHMVYEYYPLHEACSRGNKEIVQEFIWAGCNLDQPNCDGDTPLHIASMRGHVECIKLLLNAGANHKARNSKGETPLEAGRYTNQTDLHKLFEVFEKGHSHPRLTAVSSSSSRMRSSSSEATSTRLTPPRPLLYHSYANGSRDDSSVGGTTYGPKRKLDVSRTYSFSGAEPSRCYGNPREQYGSGRGKSPSPTSLLLQTQSGLRSSPQRSSLANMSHDSQLILPTQTLISDPRRTQTYHDFGASLPFSEESSRLHPLMQHSPNEVECDSSPSPALRLSAPKLRVQHMIHHLNESVSTQYGGGIDSAHIISLLSSIHGDLGFDRKEFDSLRDLSGEFCNKRIMTENERHVDSGVEYVWGCDYEICSSESGSSSPVNVSHGSPTPNYAEMVFKVKLYPQGSSEQSKSRAHALLRVITKIFDLSEKEESERYHSRSYIKTSCPEAQILTSLPPHPNMPRLLHYCPAHSRPFERFTRNFCPNECHVSLKMAPEVHLLFLTENYSSFQTYLSTKKQLQPVAPFGFKERTAILLLTQLFLALSHLDEYGILVTYLSPSDILFDARHHLVLTGLSHALSVTGKDSEDIQDQLCDYSPKTLLGFSPELAYLRDCSSSLLSEVPPLSVYLKSSNSFTAARFVTEVFTDNPEPLFTTGDSCPELSCFSPRFRDLVKRVLGQGERPTSLQSALCCFVLLFGPPEGECVTLTDCREWLVSEICSFYLRPSLKGQPLSYAASDVETRLLFAYLLLVTPESLLSAVKLVYDT